jgi:dTDP-4-amino-4,6-dideoxygalactose transaminase
MTRVGARARRQGSEPAVDTRAHADGVATGRFAVLGAPPAFDRPRHVGRPNLGDRRALMARIEGVLDRVWLTNNGPLVEEFERAVASIAGVRHCVATANGTLALEIAISAVGLRGEVVTTPFTFVATTHALARQGITPVFCDVDPRTHNIDPTKVEEVITPETTGILGVHLWGRPCAVDALGEIAQRRGLGLLYDAAHAIGCSDSGRMIGRFGRAETFSFHATKIVNAFEGGAVVTDDDDVAERARLVRNLGFADYDRVVTLGTNAKMNEVSAAMGLTSLESFEQFVTVNRAHHEAYQAVLDPVPGLAVMPYDDTERSTRQYVVVEVDEAAGLSRDNLQQILWAENVLARRYFHPGSHRQEPYRARCDALGVTLPETDRLAGRLLTLPTGTGVTAEDIAVITDIIRRAVTEAPYLAGRLPPHPSTMSGATR